MQRIIAKPAAVLMSFVILLVAGCGSVGAPAPDTGIKSDPTQASSSVSTAATGAGTGTPAAPASRSGDGFIGTAHIKDSDGYTFDIKYSYELRDVEQSTADDKPGFSSAVVEHQTALSLVNTTPGRNVSFETESGVTAPDSYPTFLLLAAWKAKSPMCRAMLKVDENWEPPTHCWIALAHSQFQGPLGSGETLDLEVRSGWPNLGVAGVVAIPDASYEVVSTALKHPDDFIIAYRSADYTRFNQLCNPEDDDGNWDQGHLVPVYSRSGKCPRRPFLLKQIHD
jgi:hypothetical protein